MCFSLLHCESLRHDVDVKANKPYCAQPLAGKKRERIDASRSLGPFICLPLWLFALYGHQIQPCTAQTEPDSAVDTALAACLTFSTSQPSQKKKKKPQPPLHRFLVFKKQKLQKPDQMTFSSPNKSGDGEQRASQGDTRRFAAAQ